MPQSSNPEVASGTRYGFGSTQTNREAYKVKETLKPREELGGTLKIEI
jgi:hypothetical protein